MKGRHYDKTKQPPWQVMEKRSPFGGGQCATYDTTGKHRQAYSPPLNRVASELGS